MKHPMIKIKQDCWDKLQRWVKKVGTTEASGMGRVHFEDGNLVIAHVYMLPAKNSAVETEFDGEAMGKKYHETINDHGHFNFWWHFHPASMSVGPSGTDDETIEQLGKTGWMLGGIFNGKEEANFRIYQGGDSFFPPIVIDDIDWQVVRDIPQSCIEAWDEEFKENFKEPTPLSYAGSNWGHDSWDEKTWGHHQHIYGYKKKPDNKATIIHESEISDMWNECETWWKKFCKEKKRAPDTASELDAYFMETQAGGK